MSELEGSLTEEITNLKAQLQYKNSEIEKLKFELAKVTQLHENHKYCDQENEKYPELRALNHSHEVGIQTDNYLPVIGQNCSCSIHFNKDIIAKTTAETQTFESDFLQIESLGSSEDWQPDKDNGVTIVDLVKSTLEIAAPQSDYVFDECLQLYYSTKTGYYYDSKRCLFYEPQSGTYYYYDATNQTYHFYCQIPPASNECGPVSSVNDHSKSQDNKTDSSLITGEAVNSKVASKRKRLKKLSEKQPKIESSDSNSDKDNECEKIESFVNSTENINSLTPIDITADNSSTRSSSSCSTLEEGEIIDDDTDDDDANKTCINVNNSDINKNSNIVENSTADLQDVAQSFPPCLRLIVLKSEKLKKGSLLLVTCEGCTVGREKYNNLCLPERSVSKKHAEIRYNNDIEEYVISDLGSQNGTWINNQRLCESRETSDPYCLKHSDYLTFGTCILLLHIHTGSETCDDCEPGQVQAKFSEKKEYYSEPYIIKSKVDKERARRQELRHIKKKFALENMTYENTNDGASGIANKDSYQDRAKERRKTKGSDNPYEKSEIPSSLDIAVPKNNKGYKLLQKMGWEEGQRLGKHQSGPLEPINLQERSGTQGLGCEVPSLPKTSRKGKKGDRWHKTQKRFRELQPTKEWFN